MRGVGGGRVASLAVLGFMGTVVWRTELIVVSCVGHTQWGIVRWLCASAQGETAKPFIIDCLLSLFRSPPKTTRSKYELILLRADMNAHTHTLALFLASVGETLCLYITCERSVVTKLCTLCAWEGQYLSHSILTWTYTINTLSRAPLRSIKRTTRMERLLMKQRKTEWGVWGDLPSYRSFFYIKKTSIIITIINDLQGKVVQNKLWKRKKNRRIVGITQECSTSSIPERREKRKRNMSMRKFASTGMCWFEQGLFEVMRGA